MAAMLDLLQAVLDGLLFGATYALIGIGFTLVFGVMHKINMAYAAASVGGAYCGLLVLGSSGRGAGLGGVPRCVPRRRRARLPRLPHLLPLHPAREPARDADVDGRHAAADRRDRRRTRPTACRRTTRRCSTTACCASGELTLRGDLLLVFVVSVVCMAGLLVPALPDAARARDARGLAAAGRGAALRHPRRRRSTRRRSSSPGSLGGIAGALIGASVGTLSPLLTTPLTVKGLIVTVIGGLGSIPGAIVAGLLVGGFENLFQHVPRRHRARPLRDAAAVRVPGVPARRHLRAATAAATEAAAMDFYYGLAQIIGVHTLLGLSAYIVLLTGQVSLAQAGFFAIGAYVAAMLTVLAGWALVPALAVGRARRRASSPARSASRRCACTG